MSLVPTLSTNWTIRFVPAEVWRRIFQFIASTSQPFDPAGIVDIIRVSHVCSTWRDVANNSPELWTNVALSFDQEGGEHCFPNEKLLALILGKSRSLPLTMGLVSTVQPMFRSVKGMKAVGLFLRTTHRAIMLKLDSRVLDVIWEDTDSGVLAKSSLQVQPALLLEGLVLGSRHEANDANDVVSELWKPAPFMRSLTLFDDFIGEATYYSLESSQFPFPFRQLTKLEFTCRISTDAVKAFLTATPSLVEVVFDLLYADFKNYRGPDPTELSRLETISIYQEYRNGEDEFAKFLHFQELPFMHTLEFIKAPNLVTLRLSFDCGWDAECFQKFVTESSRQIQHFHFDITSAFESVLVGEECIELLPSLRTLDLSFRQVGSARKLRKRNPIGEEFLEAMRHWDTSDGRFTLCPHLEKLVIDYGAIGDMNSALFADMIRERLRRSGEGGFSLILKEANMLGDTPESHSEMIRLLLLRKSGLKLTIEPAIEWMEELFHY
ncbi:hypothetical protein CVT26_012336 [Gymnopilus dilepis]|uniref:F-box domain-containing protein n=1 Tax=Gymnopilus dilepis TaxID=231916 RepID=A0A409YCD2_9AGAR|nr:hypothetical protein CVT26_012336 [Gymnopilus dilepis]